ncbi:unnamed protein product [Urochloa humidicola]
MGTHNAPSVRSGAAAGGGGCGGTRGTRGRGTRDAGAATRVGDAPTGGGGERRRPSAPARDDEGELEREREREGSARRPSDTAPRAPFPAQVLLVAGAQVLLVAAAAALRLTPGMKTFAAHRRLCPRLQHRALDTAAAAAPRAESGRRRRTVRRWRSREAKSRPGREGGSSSRADTPTRFACGPARSSATSPTPAGEGGPAGEGESRSRCVSRIDEGAPAGEEGDRKEETTA